MRPLAFVAVKTAVAMAVAAVAVALIFAIGAAPVRAARPSTGCSPALIVWLGSALFAIYGLASASSSAARNAAASRRA